jgi:hypothetical protein
MVGGPQGLYQKPAKAATETAEVELHAAVQQQQPLAGFPGPETSTPKAAMGTATRASTSTLAETRIGTQLSTAQIQCTTKKISLAI